MGKIDNRYARCIGIECTTTTGKTCLGSKEIIHHCPNMHSGVNLTFKMLLQVACVETCRENIFISIQITGIACCQYMILPFWFESKSCSYYIHLMLQSQVKPVHITWRYPCRLCKCKQKWKGQSWFFVKRRLRWLKVKSNHTLKPSQPQWPHSQSPYHSPWYLGVPKLWKNR